MKKVILVVFMIPYLVSAQIIDNFESGGLDNWIQADQARWKADTLNSISGRFSLHHTYDNTEAGNDRIALRIKNLHPDEGITKWSFAVRHGYEPSSSNNWMVFLLTESGPENMLPASCSGGYAIGVNITGSDDSLRLVKIFDNNIISVLNCGINWQTGIGTSASVRINIERSPEGEWKTEVLKMSGELIRTEGVSSQLFTPSWFGISYRYSSTKDRLFWIDDISVAGMFYTDSLAPALDNTIISGKNSLKLTFSEQPAEGSITPGIFSLNTGEKAFSVTMITPVTFEVHFGGQFGNKQTNTLSIENICDKYGNCSGKVTSEFTPVWPEKADVIISEIMADPFPAVSLPESEFIEITNRTGFTFDLRKWKLSADDQEYYFPAENLAPHEILILCHHSDTVEFRRLGAACGFSSFPVLSDKGKLICISDSSGALIHGVEYSSNWYNDDLKSQGGWSLEMIDSGSPFFADDNWIASVSRTGGTPGKINSTSGNNPDTYFKGLQNVFPEDSINVFISFSEPVFDYTKLYNAKVSDNKVVKINPVDALYREFELIFNAAFKERIVYNIVMPGELCDFAGNPVMTGEFLFGITETAERGDLLFNELLFNPVPGGSDYIEFFNKSGKSIDASRLFLISISESGDTSSLFSVSFEHRCIFPSSYYVVTVDKEYIEQSGFSTSNETLFQVDELPSMPDDKGHLLLLNRELDIIDEVRYSEKMHYSLLSGKEGISLEKTNPQLTSNEAVNWHSAAESSGWGTPGKQNSIFSEFPLSDEQVVLLVFENHSRF